MILKLSLVLPDDETYVRTMRLLSRTMLEDMNVDPVDVGDVETIVSELCSNVVRHAHSLETHFRVCLEYYKPKIVVTVTDEGRGFLEADIPPIGTLRSDGAGGVRLGGFGMSLLEGLSDKLDYSSTNPHGTTVRVEKKLHYKTVRDSNIALQRDKEDRPGIMAAIG